MSSAKPLFSQFNLLNILSNVAVNSLGEMVSPCLRICLFYVHIIIIIFLVLAMMSILLGFVLSQIPSHNPRKQHTVVYALLELFELFHRATVGDPRLTAI